MEENDNTLSHTTRDNNEAIDRQHEFISTISNSYYTE